MEISKTLHLPQINSSILTEELTPGLPIGQKWEIANYIIMLGLNLVNALNLTLIPIKDTLKLSTLPKIIMLLFALPSNLPMGRLLTNKQLTWLFAKQNKMLARVLLKEFQLFSAQLTSLLVHSTNICKIFTVAQAQLFRNFRIIL